MNRRRWWVLPLLLAPGLGLILALIGAVVYIAIAQSFGLFDLFGNSAFTLDFWTETLDRRVYWRSVRYSLQVGTVSALVSVALAYPLALWLRKPFPGSALIGAILKAPLLVHGLVAAFLYVNVIAYHGIFNQFMQAIGVWDGPRRLQNDPGAVGVYILQAWKNMPFALLLLTGTVQSISDDVLDAARDLGARTWARFWRVVLPLTASGMQAAAVIIFIGALADFSFQVIAGPTNRMSLSQLMVFFKERGDWHEAAVVGVTLMLLALAGATVLTVFMRLLARRRRLA
jgi:putative spermidine/putrescine transport system permease protein